MSERTPGLQVRSQLLNYPQVGSLGGGIDWSVLATFAGADGGCHLGTCRVE